MNTLTRVQVLRATAQMVRLEIDEVRIRRSNFYYVKYRGRRISHLLSIGEAESFVNSWGLCETSTIERLAEMARDNLFAVLSLGAGGNGQQAENPT